jgi:hypothetical protein
MTTATITMVNLECWCGCPFSAPQSLYDEHKKYHTTSIYCPHGHSVVYGKKTDIALAREAQKHAEAETARVRAMLDQETASHRATKGALTKAKKRAAAGVCPCCHRTFQNVARHMRSKHPEYPEPTA